MKSIVPHADSLSVALSVDQTFQQAIAHHQAGQLQDAERLYRAILQSQPVHPDANHNLGVLAIQVQQPAAGLPHLKAALEANPNQGQYWLSYIEALIQTGQTDAARQMLEQGRQRGLQGDAVKALAGRLEGPSGSEPGDQEMNTLVTLFTEGRYQEAANLAQSMTERFPLHGFGWKMLSAAFKLMERNVDILAPAQKAAALLPDDAEAQYNLGVIFQELNRLDEAETSYLRTLQVKPGFAEAHSNLGSTLQDMGRLNEAEASYRRALQIKPDFAEVHSNLGATLKYLGRLDEAEASYRRALQIKQDYAEVHSNLGITLKELGRLDEAEASCRQALKIKPDYAEAHSNLGIILRNLGRLEEAEASYRRALQIKPDYAEAHYNLGITLKDMGRFNEAEASYRRALQIKPDSAEAYSNLGNILNDLGRLDEAETSYRQALQIKPDYADAYSNLLFLFNYTSGKPPSYCLAEARQYGQAVSAKATQFTEWSCAKQPERLKVGLMSGDFRNHPVSFFLEGLLARLDPASVELIAYPTDRRADELTARIKPRFTAWKQLSGQSDEAAARLIHGDGIHVLVDISGHTALNRLPVFAWKPAPVQVSWLGYFATTGVTEMDYLIADPWTLPETEEAWFTEKIWRLPDTRLCFTPPNAEVEISPLPALSNGYITFGCFNDLAKMNDDVVALWARVLGAVPGSRLFLKAKQLVNDSVRQNTIGRFAAHGIDAGRLILEYSEPRDKYLAAYRRVDIALDPFPYPGGTTSVEGLWMGVPVLTLAGERFLSRQGVGILMNAGLPEWIADDADDYVARAMTHAASMQYLSDLRGRLRQQVLASPLFDAARFARHFEKALWGMWRQWVEQRYKL